jgi:hypothetical protein
MKKKVYFLFKQQQQKLAEKHALPIVRTPSKTLERPLGLVFLVTML